MVGCKLLSYTPRNKPKQQDKWIYFVDQFHELLKGVQELIFVKLHEGIKVWTLKKGIVIVCLNTPILKIVCHFNTWWLGQCDGQELNSNKLLK
jgi:hypothetical protein